MAINVADITLGSNVLLAPMAGITDLPYRRLVARFGAGLVVSEMVASQEVVQAKPEARAKAELGFGEHASSVQIAGREAHWMAEAARYVARQGAQIIDINMGCPAKKVTSASGAGASGSALMRDLDHATRLIEAVVTAVDVPVTLKCRLGWDDTSINAANLARRAEAVGVRMLTVHGRTRQQFYKGQANWAAIADVVRAVDIPVIANGDITDIATARAALTASGASGVMIGRGAQGRPWLLAQVAAELRGETPLPAPSGPDLGALVRDHYDAMLDFYGAGLGAKVARKHLGWYLDAAGDAAGLRRALLTAPTPEDTRALIDRAFSTSDVADAA